MTGTIHNGKPARSLSRWIVSLALVLGLHTGAVALLLSRSAVLPVQLPPAPEAVLLDLPSEEPPAPEPVPMAAQPQPPAPQPPLAQPPPPEPTQDPSPPETLAPEPPHPVLPPPIVVPDVVLPPPPPPPKPVQTRPPPRPVPRPMPRPAPPRPDAPLPERPAALPAPAPALPASPAPAAPPSNAVPTWRSELIGKLLHAKRYPDSSRTRGEQGTAYATFTMDRGGHVLSASVSRSSGSYLLDDEAVAMIHRAEPLPPMPAELPGASITLTVPVAFTLR